MNIQHLDAAISEAERFIAKAKALKYEHSEFCKKNDIKPRTVFFYTPKPQGMVRRASMDLTRSLAELRKP